jgi:hypothetical protein
MANLARPLSISSELTRLGDVPQALEKPQAPLELSPDFGLQRGDGVQEFSSVASQGFERAQRRVARRLQGTAHAGKLLQACMELGLIMGGLTLKERRGRSAGDIAQLAEQRLEDGLAVGLHEADTTHGASEELPAVELNHGMPTQPCTLDVHKPATVRTTCSNRDTLAEQQAWVEGEGEQWVKEFDGIVAVDLVQTAGLNPTIGT